MSSTLLKEAILDAKKLQEVALNTAKEALIEQHAEQFKEMFNNILEQGDETPEDPMSSGGDVGGLGIDVGGASGAAAPMAPALENIPPAAGAGTNSCACPDQEEEIEINLSDLFKQEPDQGQMGMDMPPTDEPMNLGENYGDIRVPADLGVEMQQYASGPNSVAYKVAQMVIAGKPVPGHVLGQAVTELERNPNAQGIASKLNPYVAEQTLETMSNDLFSMLEEDDELAKLFETMTIDQENVPDGNLVPLAHEKRVEALHVSSAKETEPETAEQNKEAEIMLEGYKRDIEKLSKAFIEQEKKNKKQLLYLQENNAKLEDMLSKTAKAIEEVNLQNAKLLYTNRILKSVSLNERQKETIVEALSKVDSVVKAKAIFDALKDGVSTNEMKKETSLNEVLKNKAPLVIPPKDKLENRPVNEFIERNKKLAGIKK